MSQNVFPLNQVKTNIFVIVSKAQVKLNSVGQTSSQQARNLSIVLDSELNFKALMEYVTKSAFYHLKNIIYIAKVWQVRHRLMHSFISSRQNYCNAFQSGLPKKVMMIHLKKNSI